MEKIELNNVIVKVEAQDVEILPYWYTEEEKIKAAKNIKITRPSKKYFYEIEISDEKENPFFDKLLTDYVEPYKNDDKSNVTSFLGTSLTYELLGESLYFSGLSKVDDNGLFSVKLEDSDLNNYEIKTDVLEYGLLAALEIYKKINVNKKV